jgi:hypothetical protein
MYYEVVLYYNYNICVGLHARIVFHAKFIITNILYYNYKYIFCKFIYLFSIHAIFL